MRIWLFHCLRVGYPFAKLMADRGLVTGIIAVNREACPNSEEYFDYSQLCKERGIEFIEVTSYSLNNEIDKEKLLSIDVDLAITSSW